MEHEPEKFPDELEALFTNARQQEPTPELLTQVRSSLAGKLDTPMPSPGAPWVLKLALAGLAIGLVAGGAVWLRSEPTPAAPTPPTRAQAGEPAENAPELPRAVTAVPLAPPTTPAPTDAAPPLTTHRHDRVAAPISEAELLDRAQAFLSTSARRALRLTREHARLYPNGALVQEREALAIRALMRLRRVAQARERLRRFATRWPGSAHLHGLRQLVDAAPDAGS